MMEGNDETVRGGVRELNRFGASSWALAVPKLLR